MKRSDGTSTDSGQEILAHGLLPMKHRWVHLSEIVEETSAVGLRKDPNLSVLRVRAQDAYAQMPFHKSGNVRLCQKLPLRLIEITSKIDQMTGGTYGKMYDRRQP